MEGPVCNSEVPPRAPEAAQPCSDPSEMVKLRDENGRSFKSAEGSATSDRGHTSPDNLASNQTGNPVQSGLNRYFRRQNKTVSPSV